MSHNPLYIDIHALQTVPPSCVNRDDTGSPKTARFGGVTRARVSSQAWKKAMRDDFQSLLDEHELGQRTKHVVEIIAKRIIALDNTVDEAKASTMATDIFMKTGITVKEGGLTDYLIFIGPAQIEAFAQLALDTCNSKREATAKAKAILDPNKRPTLNAIDVSLFGRMVTGIPNLNVDAAVQVAHALGVDVSQIEYDYFTAMDDLSPEDSSGADMINTVEFLSSTLYRYATIDVWHLFENLGSIDAARRAIEAFLLAFTRSMPTGKQNTFANHTLPSVVLMQLRDTQPVSLVNAFESPVYAHGEKSVTEVAAERLVRQAQMTDDAFGTKPRHSCATIATSDCKAIQELADESGPLNDMVHRIGDIAEDYLRQAVSNNDGQAR